MGCSGGIARAARPGRAGPAGAIFGYWYQPCVRLADFSSHVSRRGGMRAYSMKVLFFCGDNRQLDQLALALRLGWPASRSFLAHSLRSGLDILEQEEPDLVVLCEGMPDVSIWTTITEVRRCSSVPLIVMAESSDERDVVKAIELGADDYIRFPSNPMVIMARVVALLRRAGMCRKSSSSGPTRCGDLLINPATYEAFMGPNALRLTPTEFRLLYLLVKHQGTTLSHEAIWQALWPNDGEDMTTGLKKHIQRLRQKLGDDARNPRWIRTAPGVGYCFDYKAPSQ